jgi:hypothetical protein
MRGLRTGRLSAARGRLRLMPWAAGALTVVLLAAFAAAFSAPAGAVSCTDEFTGPTGGEWKTASNWSEDKVPTSSTVVCWTGKTVVVSATTAQADSILNGGSLTVESADLTLENAANASSLTGTVTVNVGGSLAIKDSASAGGLSMTGGNLDGPGSLALKGGAFSWTGGEISNFTPIAITQTGGGSFSITGTDQTYLIGGSIETTSPVLIGNPSFISENSPALKTTSTVTFEPKDFQGNGGGPVVISAAGFITSGETNVPDYILHLTGNASKVEGGTLTAPTLNTDPDTTLEVPSGAGLSVSNGTISGKVSGAGAFAQTGATTMVAAGGNLSTGSVTVNGSLTVAPTATYAVSGATTLSAGALLLEDSASSGSFSESSGNLSGPGSLALTGTFSWSGGEISSTAAIKISQTGGGSFTIDGSGQAYFVGGSIETTSPVSITNPDFISTNSHGQPSLTTTSTITLAPIEFDGNGGTPATLSAKGIVSSGKTTVQDFYVSVTGDESKVEGGALSLIELNTAAGTIVPVSGGAEVSADSGTVEGTIDGAGTYTQTGSTSTVTSGGTLSTDSVVVSTGALDVDSGATYAPTTSTTVSGGTLKLEGAASTGGLTESSGDLVGPGSLAVSGAFLWTGGEITSGGGLKITQSGGGSFSIAPTAQTYFTSGSIETSSPVSISAGEFITDNNAELTTTSTIDLPTGYNLQINGGDNGIFRAAGINANTGSEYGFGDDALVLTGGTTTVASGKTLKSGPLTVQGGVLQDDGTVTTESSLMKLTGGTLDGTGTVSNSVENTGGTVAPGDAPGRLTIDGSYEQASGGTLAVGIAGTTPATEFGQLVVKGSAKLAGNLSLQDEGGFTPSEGDTFEVLSGASARSGEFAQLTGASGSLYAASYTATGAIVTPKLQVPVNSGLPAIAGIPLAGETLSCTNGTWSGNPNPSGYTYQWNRDGEAISGATQSTYEVKAGDEGHTLTCTVTASNTAGPGTPATSAGVLVTAPPANTLAPTVSGTAAAGDTLTCSNGTWSNSPTTYTYQWSRDGNQIAGATSNTYLVVAGDEGHTLTCTVTASNAAGAGAPATSSGVLVPTPVVAPTNSAPPAISGTVAVGQKLSCSAGTWTGSPSSFSYQWSRERQAIAGATGASYTVQEIDQGHTLACTVTASNGATAIATSAGVSVPPPVPTPLPLQCSGKAVVLVTVRQSGHVVFLSGIALPKYAGQKATITLSGVSKKLAKGKGGTALIAANGSFEAKLIAPSGAGAGLTRYTATVAGNSSLALKLSRALRITGDSQVAGGARASFQVVGAQGSGKHTVTVTRELSCSKSVTFKKVTLPRSGRFSLVLPAPKVAGEVAYYRAQTHVAGGETFSLPVPVSAG